MLFSYSEYYSYLLHAKEIAPIIHVKDWDQSKKNILLRHDVDFDLSLACLLSDVEGRAGVSSSYFIMTTAATYNPSNENSRKLIQQMDHNGFEIGLHFDPSIYSTESLEVLNKHADLEASILADIIGKPIQSISLHNPSLHGNYPLFPNFINAYDPLLFSDANYLSDSCMSFRNKDPYNFLNKVQKETIQLLFHPIHFSEDPCGYIYKFRNHLLDYVDEIEKIFRGNYTVKKELGESSLLQHLLDKRINIR